MAVVDWDQLLRDAATAARNGVLHEALVDVWLYLADHNRFQAAVAAWYHDEPRSKERCGDFAAELSGAAEPDAIEVITRADALPLLVAVDQVLADEHSNWAGGLDGFLWGVQRDGVEYVVRIRARHGGAAYARQAGQPGGWLEHHWVHAVQHHGVAVDFVPCDGSLSEKLRKHAGTLPVFAAAFDDTVALIPTERAPGVMSFSGLDDEEKRWTTIESALRQATAAEAAILVLPELTVPPDLVRRLCDWLDEDDRAPLLVAAGSFHVVRGALRHNVGIIVDFRGQVVAEYAKLQPMRVGARDQPPTFIEDVSGGARICVLPTPLGLLAAPICLDFCEEGGSCPHLWSAVGLEIALVPSMSGPSTADAHRRMADRLGREHGCATVLAVQPATAGTPHLVASRAPQGTAWEEDAARASGVVAHFRSLELRSPVK